MRPDKIIQIETAAPISRQSTKPFLFGLDAMGAVFFWSWAHDKWAPLAELE